MSLHVGAQCLFCGGDASEPGHLARCDGRQGQVEAQPVFQEKWHDVVNEPVNPLHNVRRADPETSYRAAFSHLGHRACQRWQCYLAVRDAGARGLTDAELADRVGIQLNSANKRRGELRDKGLVADSGERRTTPSGSQAIVWTAVA